MLHCLIKTKAMNKEQNIEGLTVNPAIANPRLLAGVGKFKRMSK